MNVFNPNQYFRISAQLFISRTTVHISQNAPPTTFHRIISVNQTSKYQNVGYQPLINQGFSVMGHRVVTVLQSVTVRAQ